MKILLYGLALITSASSALQAAPARPSQARTVSPPAASAQSTAIMQAGLKAMARGVANATGRPIDPDMGDDHASMVALQKVCSKNTPAAQRSAICPAVSPD